MNYTKEDLRKERVFSHFYQICQIPHGSGNEKALSDYVLKWAHSLGLEAMQDSANNVLIRKPAAPGYEQLPAVMLQAHMDMVCEKAEGVEHDFMKDPIDWVIEEDTLSTGGKTSLGADDGIGMALAMAILDDNTLKHPALEVLFTVMEEDDFSGADHFDTSLMNAKYLFNLDHVNDKEVLCGSCGGMQVDIHIPVQLEPVPEHWALYRLSVSGLKGGHSGDDIHRGRGNANIILARMLLMIEDCCNFYLQQIKGGSFRLSIPREAEAYLWLDPANQAAVQEKLHNLEQLIQAEYVITADNIKICLEPLSAETARNADNLGMSDSLAANRATPADTVVGIIPEAVIDAMLLVPDGIFQMNEMFSGLVDTSDNLGEIYLDEHELHFVIEIRSAHESSRSYLFQKMERLAKLLGGSCHWSNAYPSWNLHPVSPLRQLCGEVYEQCYGEQPSFLMVHAGLEVGYFYATKPDIDAVSIGPDCWDFHSPGETVRISSVQKVYDYLCHVLAAIR